MQYTININQKYIIDSNLDVDFSDSAILYVCILYAPFCNKIEYEGKTFYWFDHNKILEEIPLLRLKKDSVYRRMKKLCDLGLISQHPNNEKMGKSFYAINEEALGFISDSSSRKNTLGFSSKVSDSNPTTLGFSSIKNETPSEKEPTNHITSIINHNTNNQKAELEKFCNDVIENFISVTGKKIKLNDHRKKLILARKKEGYGLEDFKEVIRKKNKEWKGNSQMDKHLTPDTLFSPSKFTKYVEQDEPKEGSNNNTSSKAGPTAIIPKGKRFGY